MTKQTFLQITIVLTLAVGIACSEKKVPSEQKDQTGEQAVKSETWPEMDEFHSIMAESFHPYKDSANLLPAKKKAVDMSNAAEKWLNAPLPEKVNHNDVREKLQKLKIRSAQFAELVKRGDDRKIGEELNALHDIFHELQEAWYSGGHEH